MKLKPQSQNKKKNKKKTNKQESNWCFVCEEPDFEGYHKGWCPMQ